MVDVLKNFEGRITCYNKESEEQYCTDADDLFEEFLNEGKIKEKESKDRTIKEREVKEKNKIIKNY